MQCRNVLWRELQSKATTKPRHRQCIHYGDTSWLNVNEWIQHTSKNTKCITCQHIVKYRIGEISFTHRIHAAHMLDGLTLLFWFSQFWSQLYKITEIGSIVYSSDIAWESARELKQNKKKKKSDCSFTGTPFRYWADCIVAVHTWDTEYLYRRMCHSAVQLLIQLNRCYCFIDA